MNYPVIDLDSKVTLVNAVAGPFAIPTPAQYHSIVAWKANWTGVGAYIEVSADAVGVIGDGTVTEGIGLWGGRDDAGVGAGNPVELALIGVLGLGGLTAGGVMPQIPIGVTAGPIVTRWGQVIQDVSIFNWLAFGAATDSVTVTTAANITVNAYRIIGG